MRARRSAGNPEGFNLFDSHCHLTDGQFHEDLKLVLRQAFRAGVREMMTVSENVPDAKEAVALARRHEGLYCSVGVHPHEADSFRSVDVMAMRELCIEPNIKAVGEIGLDFFRGISSRPNQEVAFEVQIDMAKSLDLPMVIHVRDASGRARAILEEHDYFCGVLHCFSGDRKMAEWAVEHGLYISFAGNITYNDDRLNAVLPAIPRERLLVETDSPYLPPVPERGGRNEPAYLVHTVRHVAGLLGLTPRETGDLTRDNARRLYRIPG